MVRRFISDPEVRNKKDGRLLFVISLNIPYKEGKELFLCHEMESYLYPFVKFKK